MASRKSSREFDTKLHRRPLTDDDGDVRELKQEDAAEAVPFSALPETERTMLLAIQGQGRKRGPQKSPKKIAISIRLSADVAEGLRATGDGWQGRADEALRSWLERTNETVAK